MTDTQRIFFGKGSARPTTTSTGLWLHCSTGMEQCRSGAVRPLLLYWLCPSVKRMGRWRQHQPRHTETGAALTEPSSPSGYLV
ncbi:hypothetical protein FQN60_007886 [Etheostoma spectabile]|uniref:Uncharacterized protein n=1 Tax=Etheostoma spectabile TaxID=54343 RepID=A0A5J5CX70_9PERO|nr:hypothetical protein FQN60_007886 [Etheostoma spectabile]